jgi:bifunctional polynucleotide phosphatase/kinase
MNNFDFTIKKYKSIYIIFNKYSPITNKIASFDLDGTLIIPSSGNKFPKNENDWKWLYNNIPDKLNELYNNNWNIIIFTNQNGLSKGKIKISTLITKFKNIIQQLNFPITIFISTADDNFRKPQIGMWKIANKLLKIKPNLFSESFFVGDAAGRINDFSCSDRKFALNIGINFYTPEEYFLNYNKQKFNIGFNPFLNIQDSKIYSSNQLINNQLYIQNLILQFLGEPSQLQLIIMVGPPASGKTTICKKYLIPNNYIYINNDTLKSKNKCLLIAENSLRNGESCVIDNTNPKKIDREPYLQLANKYGAISKCIEIDISINTAQHLNNFRYHQSKFQIKKIPIVAYRIFYKYYQSPNIDEGFDDIYRFNNIFELLELNNKNDLKLWFNYY